MLVRDLKTGDHISVPGRAGVEHHGIVDRRGRGGIRVIHACKRAGLVLVNSLVEFSGRQRITLVRRAERGERIEIATRARDMVGEPYDVLGSNCEHLAYGASHNDRHSPQLRSAVVGTLATVAGVAFSLAVTRR